MSRIIRAALAACAGAVAVAGSASTAHADPSTFRAAADAPPYVRLQVEYSKTCLTIVDGSIREGAYAVEGTCSTEAENQLFRLRPVGGAAFELMAKHSGRCLTDPPEDQSDVLQRWCDDRSGQRWKVMLVEVTKELYELRPVNRPDECLSMGGYRPGEEPKVYITTCYGLTSQRWRFLPATS
ncbi:RICIN domain-containing protein [Streptomyces sp. NPDC059851]|uniref:RICIN domain-containing protein n=1 Tax=Streptomyces sp. NPDC059851 TaxID=3346971 RepID=UPI003669C30D